MPYLAYLKQLVQAVCCVLQADVNRWRQWHESMHEWAQLCVNIAAAVSSHPALYGDEALDHLYE